MKNVSKFLLLLFLPLTVFLSSCEDNSVSLPGINLFSPADDAELGSQLNDEIASNPSEFPLYDSPQLQNYLNDMLDEILDSPEIEYKNTFNYSIQIIQKDEINAFAAPGGYIYVYTGLLKFLDYEATLAAIIAHEVAHVELRHATQRMTTQYGYSILASVILGDDPSTLEQMGANLLTGLGLLQNSREDEYEADEYSFNYLKSTKWYPGAGIFFFDKVKSNESSTLFEELLSTHPMPEERIEALEKLIDEANLPVPDESNLFENDYKNIKKLVP